MRAVIKAILLDYEARSASLLTQQGYGKQREPVCRVAAVARAFPAPTAIGGTYSQSGSLVSVATTNPHLYSANQSVYLDFEASTSGDAGSPLDALYTIVSVPNSTSFAARTKSFEAATYIQGGAVVRFITPTGGNGFFYTTNESIYAEYLDGNPLPASGTDTVEFVTSDELQFFFGGPTAKRGTYSQNASSTNIVISTSAHGFTVGSSLHIDFLSGSQPTSGLYTITAVTTNTYTVTAAEMLAR